MDFLQFLTEQVALFDGGMGTEIQKLDIRDNEWGGYSGCNEILSLSSPVRIASIHRDYLEAGADVIETNTFGAQRLTLQEYGLAERTEEINREAVKLARREIDTFRTGGSAHGAPRFVAGAVGPGTMLPSLGHVHFSDLYTSYSEQAAGLCQGGVDLFIVETSQDPLQAKAALLAIRDAQHDYGHTGPVIVSVTVESAGTLLVGSTIEAVVTAIEPLGPDIMGINCATGPEEMRPHIRRLAGRFSGPVFCMPNAGFPEERDGELVYTLSPDEFAATLTSFVREYGVDVIGGCCGADPRFIRALRRTLSGLRKAKRNPVDEPALASLYSFQPLRQEPPPLFIGERANPNGSKAFRNRLLEDDLDGMTAIAKRQDREGAHALDLSVAYTGRDEQADMERIVPAFVTAVDLPLVIDSTNPPALEAALQHIGGRALINSVNLEEGEEHAAALFSLAARYGAAIICLTIDEEGMAMTSTRKVEVADRIIKLAGEAGLRPWDLIIDPLTFTLGSGDASLKHAGAATLEALRLLKERHPEIHTILGVSNISYGLAPRPREVLSSIFLREAVKAGLDCAIVNVRKILPPARIPEEDGEAALRLIYNRDNRVAENPLLAFIEHFSGRQAEKEPAGGGEAEEPPPKRLRRAVIEGEAKQLEELLPALLEERKAEEIIQEHLIPAMQEVGRLFGEGTLQLPFVLQSAEIMKQAVDRLTPYLTQEQATQPRKVILATVRGDVHDIGKNLVDIILSNNGYEVHNLGIKCDIETIIEKARVIEADAIGMSGLLVKSTVVMQENLERMRTRGLELPVLLGGAALTRDFVQNTCDPLLDSPVFYCRDAFDGLRALDSLFSGAEPPASGMEWQEQAGKQRSAPAPSGAAAASASPDEQPSGSPTQKRERAIRPPSSHPDTPLKSSAWLLHQLDPIPPEHIFSFVREPRLFTARWGYRRGQREEELRREEILPHYRQMRETLYRERLLSPRAAWRLFPCYTEGDTLLVHAPDSGKLLCRIAFPRRQSAPHTSVADFFRTRGEGGGDSIALQIVTLGSGIKEYIDALYAADRYKEYLLTHGLAVELTEALADYTHARIVSRLPANLSWSSAGTRFSFGYPCCPELEHNRTIGALLQADRLEIEFTDEGQMVPEFSTSGFISFAPEAHYFSMAGNRVYSS